MVYHDTDRSYANTAADQSAAETAAYIPSPSPVATPVSPPPAPYQPSLAPAAGGGYMGAPVTYSGGGGGGGAPSYSTGGFAGPGTPATQLNLQDTTFAWLLGIPDVASVLNSWNTQTFPDQNTSNEWLKSHIMQTDWFKTHSASTRDWIQLQTQDPATAQQDLLQKQSDILAQATKLGLSLNTNIDWSGIATRAITEKWDDTQVLNYLGQLPWAPGGSTASQSGMLQQQQQKFREMANQYLVPVSDQALTYWADSAVFQGQGDTGFENYVKQQAKSLFPGMAQAIDQGITVQQFADPYRQLAAKELEVNPSTIDFMQPKWSQALNQVDPKTGQRTAMSMSDWQTKIRTDPTYGYDHTAGAQQAAADLSTQLLQKFGQV